MRFLPAAVLSVGCVFLLRIGGQSDTPLAGTLDSLPREIDGFIGLDQTVSDAERKVAGMDHYLMRAYGRDTTRAFSLYVGYYEAQKEGKSIHSPKNCLPGAGWEPVSNGSETIVMGDASVTVNRYVLERGNSRAIVYYWYQGRGRVSWNEYAVKWELLRDKAVHGRSEEALVRIVVPVDGAAPDSADARARSVARQVIPQLFRVLPPLDA